MNFPISIIVPIFNEEKRVKKGLVRLLEVCNNENWDFEIIVVEDGCTDNSVKIVEKLRFEDNRIRVLSLSKRYGKGGSILQAIKECKKENIGYLDIDMSADPTEFNRLFPFLHDNTMVIGSRVLRGNLGPIDRPYLRNFLSKMYSISFSLLFDAKILDTQCGLKLFKKNNVLPILPFIKTNGFAFDTEFIIKMLTHGVMVKEVPINWHHVVDSKVNISKVVFAMSKDLLKIWTDTVKIQNQKAQDKYRLIVRPKFFIKSVLKTERSLRSIKNNVLNINSGKFTTSY